MIRRREFLTLAALAAAGLPSVGSAQEKGTKRIGVLLNQAADDPRAQVVIGEIWAGLAKHGWSLQNLRADYRFSANTSDAASGPAMELLSSLPDVVLPATSPPLIAMAQLTRTVPIVFAYVNGSTVSTLVRNFARPEGNITGFAYVPDTDVYGKNIDLLKELEPEVRKVALIYNPGAVVGGEAEFLNGYVMLATNAGLQLVPFAVRTPDEIAEAVRQVASDATLGLIVNGDAYIFANRAPAIAEVAKYRLPTVWSSVQTFATDGGLVVYAPDAQPIYQGAGEYAGLILNGTPPAELPIQVGQELLTVNLKTAKAQGIIIPATILARADQVIE